MRPPHSAYAGSPGLDRRPHLGAKCGVRGERVHVRFGKTAADEKPVHTRQALVADRVEGDSSAPAARRASRSPG